MNRRPCLPLFCAALLVLVASIFVLTGSRLRFGYEGFHIDEAVSWVTDAPHTPSPGGVLDVLAYVPSALVFQRLVPPPRAESLRRISNLWVQPLLGATIVLVMFLFARELFGRLRTALFLALALAFTTMVWPYAKFGMENWQTLFTLLSVWMLWRYVESPTRSRAAAFAAAMSLLALTKITGMAHAAAIFAAGLFLVARRGVWKLPAFRTELFVGTAIAAVGIAVLLATNKVRYGGFLVTGRYNVDAEFSSRFFWHSLGGATISLNKSLFVFSPPLLVALWYWRRLFARAATLLPIVAALLGVAVWYCAVNRFFNDETWGPRRLVWLVPLLLLPLGEWFERLGQARWPARLFGGAALTVGLVVQLLAVSFDYTAHAFAMAKTPAYSIENTVWKPSFNALRFNVHLYHSLMHRRATGQSLPYVIESEYIPWDAPEQLPDPLVFDVSRYDHLDSWILGEQRFWTVEAGRRFWFEQASSFVVIAMGLLAILAAWACFFFHPGGQRSDPQRP